MTRQLPLPLNTTVVLIFSWKVSMTPMETMIVSVNCLLTLGFTSIVSTENGPLFLPSPGVRWHLGNYVSDVICWNGGSFIGWSYISSADICYSECCISKASQVRLLMLKSRIVIISVVCSALTNSVNDPTCTTWQGINDCCNLTK